MTEQHNGKTDEGLLAVDIIKRWKTNPRIRKQYCQRFVSYVTHRERIVSDVIPIFSRGYN